MITGLAVGEDDIRCYYLRGLAYYYLDRCDLAVPILQESLERTESDNVLGFIRQGLRLCQVDTTGMTAGEADVEAEVNSGLDEGPIR